MYVGCVYSTFWWVGLIQQIDREYGDLKIDFMHPHGPRKNFIWPRTEDTCFIPLERILCRISVPLMETGRSYKISDEDFNSIVSEFQKH